MRRLGRLHPLPLAAAILSACAGPAAPPAPPALAYAVPADPTAVYVQGDTAEVMVDAGGQTVEVAVASRSVMEMGFAPADGGAVRITATIRDFEATATNPMGPSQSLDEEAIDGELVLLLSRTGEGTLVSAPDLEGSAQQFVSPAMIASTFFPRLPGRPVTAGDTWTDTVTVDADQGESSIESTSVVRYTAVGDTVVEGRSYLLVRTTSVDERMYEGRQMGMDMTQEVEGVSEGWFLWDPARGLPAEVVTESESEGVMEVSAAPFPLTMKLESTSRITLQPLAGGM